MIVGASSRPHKRAMIQKRFLRFIRLFLRKQFVARLWAEGLGRLGIPPKGGTTNFSENLKRESNPELHLPGNRRSGRRAAEVGGRDTDRSDAEGSAGRHFKNRVIEGVDHLGAELHP